MIKFRIANYTGTYEDGEFTIDQDTPGARALQDILQEEFDQRLAVATGYAPGEDIHALLTLGSWGGIVEERTGPEAAEPPAVN